MEKHTHLSVYFIYIIILYTKFGVPIKPLRAKYSKAIVHIKAGHNFD